VAVIVSAVILAVFILFWMVAAAVDPPFNEVLSGLAIHHQNFQPFLNGILEMKGVAYYTMMTYFFLLCATKTLEARRWR
jgi:ABC-2 type transport system permease protein